MPDLTVLNSGGVPQGSTFTPTLIATGVPRPPRGYKLTTFIHLQRRSHYLKHLMTLPQVVLG